MRIKTLSIPVMVNPIKRRVESLYKFFVNSRSETRTVVNVNEDMSSSRLRSFIGSAGS